jgi:hypothetical protein
LGESFIVLGLISPFLLLFLFALLSTPFLSGIPPYSHQDLSTLLTLLEIAHYYHCRSQLFFPLLTLIYLKNHYAQEVVLLAVLKVSKSQRFS